MPSAAPVLREPKPRSDGAARDEFDLPDLSTNNRSECVGTDHVGADALTGPQPVDAAKRCCPETVDWGA
ncbi:hypothetical protein [Nocardia barduliensis]|uniref:hypothetical protein n=1 Tax=Nocardia barduliensis TaxID=2736643 RepID=UPI001572AA7D|nr:hypothetical protein [Nocardia barduliensis]